MARDDPEQLPVETSPEDRIAPSSSAEPSLSRNTSYRRLNAQAPEFVPRTPPANQAQARMEPRMVQIHHAPPAAPPVMHIFHHQHPPPHQAFHHVPVVQGHSQFEYYGGGEGGHGDHEMVHSPVDPDPATPPASATSDGLSDDVIQKITKQVEYYFSDANLATTEHLMRFISKDPEGFGRFFYLLFVNITIIILVPISVIAAFKKIKALISNNAQLAAALRTSSKLVVSDDGKKVRRLHPFTEADVEELQSRIIVAENLPEDHCYQNLLKVFSVVGSVKAIRTCYPQATNGTASTTSRPGKIDTLFGNKWLVGLHLNMASFYQLHAFVEYETIEDAEKAVAELNDERDWRSGLRVRLLPSCMTKHGRGRKGGHEGDRIGDDEDVSASNQHHEKHFEDPSQPIEVLHEHVGEDDHHDKEGGRRGRGRGRGSRGRGRGQYNHHSHRIAHVVAAPSSHPTTVELSAATKQPPGPRMPDGTRGFTMGRGKQLGATNVVAS
ncbi:hypothetical protein Taro_033417 [Colocasia esculenta]|uniref:HTH La-type RNA-binding domain-containing protein n=1 Tax=Colocasia esculenta TaxID=4460 RepID=A0A843W035_COLES|nr:hypothetical protein [Colocasia esculenta]